MKQKVLVDMDGVLADVYHSTLPWSTRIPV